jgi:flagellar biosynthesis component FlhA
MDMHFLLLVFPSMQHLLLLLMSGLLILASYHMAKDKAIFSTLNECNTKQIFVGDDRSLSVVGSGTIQAR